MKTFIRQILLLSLVLGTPGYAESIGTPIVSLDEVTEGIEFSKRPTAPDLPNELVPYRFGILASHGVQDSEIVFSIEYLRARGATVEVLVPGWSPDRIIAVSYLRPKRWIKADTTFLDAQTRDYDTLILTGGAWNAQVVGTEQDALQLITQHASRGRAIAAICAGPLVLVQAGLVKGKRMTGTDAARVILMNAGATWIDAPVVEEGQLLSAKGPDSLPLFMDSISAQLKSSQRM